MAKLKTKFDLIDRWRKAKPSMQKFTWEGTSGTERKKVFLRIDRIYISMNTWKTTNKYKMINCDLSDHDGISVMIRKADDLITGMGELKMNMKIVNDPSFREEALCLLNKLERQLGKYETMESKKNSLGKEEALTRLREKYNPQSIWEKYKVNILKASGTATQT